MSVEGAVPLYDALSDDYDRFVNWENRLAYEMPFIERTLRGVDACRVLDVACGTGMHAIELARRGYKVVGSDPSVPMIRRARGKDSVGDLAHGEVRFIVAGFGELAEKLALSPVLREACPEPSPRARPEQSRRACPEPSRRACAEPSRRARRFDPADGSGARPSRLRSGSAGASRRRGFSAWSGTGADASRAHQYGVGAAGPRDLGPAASRSHGRPQGRRGSAGFGPATVGKVVNILRP